MRSQRISRDSGKGHLSSKESTPELEMVVLHMASVLRKLRQEGSCKFDLN